MTDKVWNIKIDYSVHTENVGGYDSEDDWSRDSYEGTVYVKGFNVVGEKDYHDFPINFDPKNGIYLVYVVYTTGDSFGYDGGQVEFITAYDSAEKAEENAKKIRDHYNQYKANETSDYSVSLKDNDGNTFQQYASWEGYFEHIDELIVEHLTYKRNFMDGDYD